MTGMRTLYFEPGSPWQNGYVESFNARLRDESLNAEVFEDVRHAQVRAYRWRNEYCHRRPHSALGYVDLAMFAAQLRDASKKNADQRDLIRNGDEAPPRSRTLTPTPPHEPHAAEAAGTNTIN